MRTISSEPRYVVDLRDPPSARWRHVALIEGVAIRRLLRLLRKRLSVPRSCVAVAASALAGCLGEEWVEEVHGIADTAGVSRGSLISANLSYELLGLACSSASCVQDGKPVMARVLDWWAPRTVGKYTIIVRIVRRDGSFYDAVTFPGYVGVLTAMSREWGVAVNMAPRGLQLLQYLQTPVAAHVRQACDGSESYRGLLARLRAWQTAAPFFAHVIGRTDDQRVIITGHGSHYETTKRDPMAVTNHYFDEETDDEDSEERLDILHRRLQRGVPANRLMVGFPIISNITQQRVLMCPADQTMAVSIKE